ncbi:MAG: TetR/AcrR family transcriptional regulator [Alphaproteobacteria bacterium]|nr:TetR/AcrR family transcriptional regulator [Alphaproteobacteria bacterium]
MARSRAFDVDEALQAAMHAFWRHGYRGTSVRDLCEAMGIGQGSFYAAFGSKAELFQRALGHYLRTLAPEPGPDALRVYLDRVVSSRDPTGCLLVDSAVERAELEPEAQALVDRGLAGLQAFFASCLPGPEAERRAALLLSAVAGLHVMHRAGRPTTELRALADHLLVSVDIARPPQ